MTELVVEIVDVLPDGSTSIALSELISGLQVIPLEELPWDESILYGKHAYLRHPEQISVWELYGDTDIPYVGRHRDDGYPDRLFGEPMVMWSPFFEAFIRHNMGGPIGPIQVIGRS
ncbi:hypothetical protein MINTM005_13080 [Mycobacterium intracellulare]|uniref:hypothetical protein n=1 Tax=Mycobacterium intracellulare TaxID=1767 RepID=UPI0019270C54|nr:hypothetical protein [Mycobacterium intracellulare]BCO56064.1 hypothetical protein MINTM005_13080 [Mycobacterium intracellulare]